MNSIKDQEAAIQQGVSEAFKSIEDFATPELIYTETQKISDKILPSIILETPLKEIAILAFNEANIFVNNFLKSHKKINNKEYKALERSKARQDRELFLEKRREDAELAKEELKSILNSIRSVKNLSPTKKEALKYFEYIYVHGKKDVDIAYLFPGVSVGTRYQWKSRIVRTILPLCSEETKKYIAEKTRIKLAFDKLQEFVNGFIKLADDEADELLKKRINENEIHDFEKVLLKHNIIPIISLEDSSFLGKGHSSKVFEVSYKGKHAVAKITPSKNDYNAIIKLDQLRQSLGDDAKHIAIVYDYFYDEKTGVYVIVVEKLNPLNQFVLNKLNFTSTKWDITKKNIDKKWLIDKIYKILSDEYNREIIDEVINYILNLIIVSKTITEFENLLSPFSNFFTNLKNKHKLDFENFDDYVFFIKDSILNHILFPTQFGGIKESTIDETLENKLEIKNFIKFLFKLKNEFGVRWMDLHEANIMERPGTHDLVISDPGNFEFYLIN